MVDHAAKIIHEQIFSDGANPYRTLNSAFPNEGKIDD
jgi:hypothetical protein